jgi:hypothetical protein
MSKKKARRKKRSTREHKIISKNSFMKRIAQSVHKVMQASDLPMEYIVAPPPLASHKVAALAFAQSVTKNLLDLKKPPVICQYSLPLQGYLSWLLIGPLGIAFDSSQVVSGHQRPTADVQLARAIIHECGHIFGTRKLLSRSRKRVKKSGKLWTPRCTPQEEEAAWVWAMCAFGIAIGHYAYKNRSAGYIDDTPGVPV